MPVYCFKCPACGAKAQKLRTIGRRNDEVPCPKCPPVMAGHNSGDSLDVLMVRDIQSEGLGSTDLPYDKPVLSDAMGVHPDQVGEFRKAHPHIEMNGEGQVVCRSHREHRRVMKELGYHDRKGFN